ncbi:MAG: C25 family cysteine peptidase, partial [Anaerolineae bacterium]|nr:C25 family cysteine peptidase [Anaerolineae bacterium]
SAWQGHFGFVDWWGHGSYTGAYRRIWSTDSAPPNPGDHLTQHPAETQDAAFFESTDAPLLSDDYPAFVVQVSCDNGTPEYELNLGYRLLEHGAVGTVSSSRVSWYSLGTWSPGSGDGVADNASFGYHIFKRMVQGDQTVGQALAACRGTLSLSSANALWMNCTDFNLYGDPALGLSTSGSGQGLNVFNDGTAYLSVTSITEQSGSDWLSVLPPEPYPFTVAPGGSRRVLVTVNPEGLAAGTYTDRLLLASDDADMSPYPGGVTVTLNVLAGLSPDLVASTPVPSVLPPFHEGQTVEWAVTVTNQGEAGAAATRVGYYLGSSCPDLGRLLADDATEALAPGASDGSQVTCEFQPGDAGERYLVAVADHLNEEPGEGDEENNCACYGPFEVLATYSLYTSTTPAGAGSVAATPPPNASGGRYISGTVVQLDAGAATGYAFDHWSGAASGTSNPTTVTMDAHKVVTATFCALPATPALLSPADGNTTADTTPTFTWQAAAGATDYRVQVDPDPDFPAPIVDETAEATSYTPASALALGTYFWRVRGESSCGSGGWSVVRSLTISATACSDPYEPNDAPAQATPISYGQTLAGAEICPAGDVDVYAFTGAAGERIIASVSAGGPALDSYLRLLAPDGVTLLAEDDGTGSDAEISFALTASGTHYLVVEDRAGAGGPDYGYSLSLVREARKLYLPLCLRP